MINKVKDLLDYIDSLDNLYLYGAGVMAEKYWQLWQKYNISINGCIVTEREDNPVIFHGKPVYSLRDLSEAGLNPRDINIIVATADGTMEKWMPVFYRCPSFKSVLFISQKLKEDIALWHWRDVL